jgi:hypothetical protein
MWQGLLTPAPPPPYQHWVGEDDRLRGKSRGVSAPDAHISRIEFLYISIDILHLCPRREAGVKDKTADPVLELLHVID